MSCLLLSLKHPFRDFSIQCVNEEATPHCASFTRFWIYFKSLKMLEQDGVCGLLLPSLIFYLRTDRSLEQHLPALDRVHRVHLRVCGCLVALLLTRGSAGVRLRDNWFPSHDFWLSIFASKHMALTSSTWFSFCFLRVRHIVLHLARTGMWKCSHRLALIS